MTVRVAKAAGPVRRRVVIGASLSVRQVRPRPPREALRRAVIVRLVRPAAAASVVLIAARVVRVAVSVRVSSVAREAARAVVAVISAVGRASRSGLT